MSEIFKAILELVEREEVVISNHGYDEKKKAHKTCSRRKIRC
jgi:hypothetical protein